MMLHDQEVAESTVKALREKTVDSRMRVTVSVPDQNCLLVKINTPILGHRGCPPVRLLLQC